MLKHRRIIVSQRRQKRQVSRTLQLAEKLGATTATVFGINVANTVIEYARKHNITRIIIGKTLRPRWQEFVFGSVVDQLIHNSGTIDVYVISSEEKTLQKPVPMEPLLPASLPQDYIASLVLVAFITIIGWLIKLVHLSGQSRHAVPAWSGYCCLHAGDCDRPSSLQLSGSLHSISSSSPHT